MDERVEWKPVRFRAEMSTADNCVCNACHNVGKVVKLTIPETRYWGEKLLESHPLDANAPAAGRRMIMTEFISRNYGKEGYEIIIKTDSHEHYRATEEFARRLIDHSKPATNTEKIRAIIYDKLSELLYEEICHLRTSEECNCYDDGDCDQCVLDWLQQPAEVEE